MARGDELAKKVAARGKRKTDDQPTVGAMPAEQVPAPPLYSKRLPVMITDADNQALVIARAHDGLPATARIRALLALWQTDPAIRERTDTLARTMR